VGFDLIRFDIDQCSLGDTRCFGKLSLRHKSFAPCRFHAFSQSHASDYRQREPSYELFATQHILLARIFPIYFLKIALEFPIVAQEIERPPGGAAPEGPRPRKGVFLDLHGQCTRGTEGSYLPYSRARAGKVLPTRNRRVPALRR
jgi:hypothetical protein